jgi:hypothetical protein
MPMRKLKTLDSAFLLAESPELPTYVAGVQFFHLIEGLVRRRHATATALNCPPYTQSQESPP